MTTILLADHHSLFRAGMVELTHSIGGFTIAGEVDWRNLPLNLLLNTHQTFCC